MDPNKKILIIARDFPPYYHSIGGVARVLKLAEFLLSEGYEVHILAAKGEEISYFGYENLVKKLHLNYIDDPWQVFYNKQYLDFIQKKTSFHGSRNVFLNLLRVSFYEICTPDTGIFFINRYIKKAIDIIKGRNIANVFVSSPAHSMQIVGLKLKNIFGNQIRYIADYRDSWNTTGLCRKRFFPLKYISEQQERAVLSQADYFTYCSPPMLEKINRRYFDISRKSVLILNGYDAKLITQPTEPVQNDSLTIGYFGRMTDQLSSTTNPTNFFEAILKLNTQKIKVVIYGPTGIISQSWKDKLGNRLEIRPSVLHAELVHEMRRMDVLLVLYSDKDGASEVISGKLYDYMTAEKSILVVGPRGMEAGKIVNKEHIGYVADLYDEEGMLNVLKEIYTTWEKRALITYSVKSLAQYSRQFQYSRLLPLLK